MQIVLLGPPGTGKGTQAKLMAERLDLAHVSTGEMFRDAVAAGTDLGKRAKAYMDRGELVPDEVTIGMLEARMRQPDAQKGMVYDGFPRTRAQAEALDAWLARLGLAVDIALLITADDDEIVRRLSGRWMCPKCGEIFQDTSRPPRQPGVCDACGSRLTQRQDDKAEVIRERLERQRPPADLLEHYRSRGKLAKVDGQRDVDEVASQLLETIASLGKQPAKR